MREISKPAKTILFLLAVAGVVWYGATTARLLSIYQIYDGVEMRLNEFAVGAVLPIFHAINPILVATMVAYVAFVALFVAFVVVSKLSLRWNGWLFMSLLIVGGLAPYELYLIAEYDFHLAHGLFYGWADSAYVEHMALERVKASGSYVLIQLASHLVALYLFVFQPMTKKPPTNED